MLGCKIVAPIWLPLTGRQFAIPTLKHSFYGTLAKNSSLDCFCNTVYYRVVPLDFVRELTTRALPLPQA